MADRSSLVLESDSLKISKLRRFGHHCLWTVLTLVVSTAMAQSARVETDASQAANPAMILAEDGEARGVIVANVAAGNGTQYAVSELQRYLQELSGAKVPIVSDTQNLPPGRTLIVVGGPDQNRVAKEAANAQIANFTGLKPDGFLLKTVHFQGHPALIAGGNNDAATMYAVFDFVGRLGVTFRLTGDIVSPSKRSLEIPFLDVREQPVIDQRGFLIELSHHPSVTMLSYKDYVAMIDQMVKMKLNFLELWWFAYSPYLDYSYGGEDKLIGDLSNKNSGYLNSVYVGVGSHTTADVHIGKKWFPNPRLAPPELQNVETPQQAFTIAQDMLRKIIEYANTRHVKVWLVDEIAAAPPNLARFGERIGELPFEGVYGTYMHPEDTVDRDIQTAKLAALIKTYPGAAGYLLNIPEIYTELNNARHRDFFAQEAAKFQGLRPLMQPWADRLGVGRQTMVDSDIGFFDLVKYLLAQRDKFAPTAKVGMMTVGRGYVMPLFDRMLPKDVVFSDFDSGGLCGYGTPQGMPMNYFGGIEQRDRIFSPYLDNDCDTLGLQFNVGVYTHKDHIYTDGVANGLTGVAPWMVQPRGTEANSTFLAEADWDPTLTRERFYRDYAVRLFGPEAAGHMYEAFMHLEDQQAYLTGDYPGFGRDANATTMPCCGVIPEIRVAYEYAEQPDAFDGPAGKSWAAFITTAPAVIATFEGSISILNKALDSMHAAEPTVAPQGKQELQYLINRTTAYRDDMQAEVTERRAFMLFDDAFRTRAASPHQQFVEKLEASLELFEKAEDQVKVATEDYAQIIDYPSDLEALYNLNVAGVTGFDLIRQWMEQITNYHEGKLYTKQIDFGKILPGRVPTAR